MQYHALSVILGFCALCSGVQAQPSSWVDVLTARHEGGDALEIVVLADRSVVVTATRAAVRHSRNAAECPALELQLKRFGELPDLTIGPLLLLPRLLDPNQPMPSYAPHAEAWDITTAAFAPDAPASVLTLRDADGPHAGWVNDTMAAVFSCDPQADDALDDDAMPP